MDNLSIWESVEKTDPSFTKKFSVGGYYGTSISGQYVYMRLTEVFGPVGIGWGYEIVQERYDEGAPFVFNEIQMVQKTHTIHLRLWYVLVGNPKAFIDGFGHTPYLYSSGKGTAVTVDQEAPKKSLTDAIKKCASMLGIGADIFMGLHDDNDYMQELRNEVSLEKAEDKVQRELEIEMERKEYLQSVVKLIGETTTKAMLEGVFKGAVRKLSLRKDDSGIIMITKAKDAALERLNKPEVKA